ncbi:PTS sugar transporter subunit IIC [Erysipelothrix sp. HDW6A]|uniref:PTS sugar transporter subunit IIC n=1 Tax=Erysipelothrix sp. HDW6A TaxID=2714928 RepID=UPI00140D1467|nr:PTS transporter subunit EIIC [Erysipelothrix sp. HDW6A]QIK57250.1 PTS sugar transporter subunit IIC [Erysipelothrix sp. HDW6A]
MKNLERFLSDRVEPLASKLQEINVLGALMEGFIRTSPVTLGYALLSIITSFMGMIEIANPLFIEGSDLASKISITQRFGLEPHFTALGNAASAMLAIYAVYSIATAYAKRINTLQMNAALVSVASFFILIPFDAHDSVSAITGMPETSYSINLNYLGAKGMLVAILVALFIPQLVKLFSNSKLQIKLPDSVPTMIQESLEPMITTGIIFIIVLLIRIGFASSAFGNVFDFVDKVLSKPVTGMIGSPIAMIVVLTLINFLWFFGIHNAVLQGPLSILSITLVLSNIQAAMQGQPMPYVATAIVSGAVLNSGAQTGLILILLFAKSQRYKSITRLSIVPAVFNITEPLMFGLPIVMNPIFFFPQVFAPLFAGIVAWVSWATFLGQYTFNPAMSLLPFVIPKPISGFLSAGLKGLIMWIIVTAITAVIWYPFVKVADKKAFEEELNI